MAGTVPQEARALAEFVQSHALRWIDLADQIGLTSEQAQLVADRLPPLTAAIQAANAARQAALSATNEMNLQSRELFEAAANAVRAIRVHAINTRDRGVYSLALIDPPKDRARQADAPIAPTDIDTTLESDGTLVLSWIAPQPGGIANVSFDVRRSLNGSTTFTFIGAAGPREFRDQTIPLGTQQVRYTLTPRHGKRTGTTSRQFTTQFGTASPENLAPLHAAPAAPTAPPTRRAA